MNAQISNILFSNTDFSSNLLTVDDVCFRETLLDDLKLAAALATVEAGAYLFYGLPGKVGNDV